MNRSSLWLTFLTYLIWGLAPLYWYQLTEYLPLFTLANRIVWGALFLVLILLWQRKWPIFRQTLGNWRKMRFLLPAAVLVACNWGLYIWAMTSGHIVDASLGYFIYPLLASLCSWLIFHEKITRLQWLAFFLALTGVLVLTLNSGSFPFFSLGLALTFMLYGTLKKFAAVDNVVSTFIETILLFPLAFLYIFTLGSHAGGLAEMDGLPALLLMLGAGVLTAIPLCLFAKGINDLPMLVVGFLQYISPTIALLCGLALGETVSTAKLVCFLFIWSSLALFSLSIFLAGRRHAREARLEQAV